MHALFSTTRGPDGARKRRSTAGRFTAAASVPVLAAAAVGAVALSGGPGAAGESSAGIRTASDAQAVFTLHGHGHGHGRGMGQWGAYGYAKDHGWSFEQILKHYYGGTQLSQAAPEGISVRLMGRDGQDLAVTSDAPMTVDGHDIQAGQAVTLHPTPAGADVTITAGCGGEQLDSYAASDAVVRSSGSPLSICGGGTYRGDLGVALDGGAARTVNYVGMDDYLRGVLPEEISPGWADQGAGEALKAQAVAARSYASAQHRYDYADTCDTQSCQVYGGARVEDPRTDAAVQATSGTIVTRGGEPVSTEFSASTGGYTAGGDFPAVQDAGDSASPDHDWTETVTAAQVSGAFGVGQVQDMTVTARNGLGDDGGRVVTLHVKGTGGAVDVTGPEARKALGLKSDWFTIEGDTGSPTIVPPDSVGPAQSRSAQSRSALGGSALGGLLPDSAGAGDQGPEGQGTGDSGSAASGLLGDVYDIVGGAGLTTQDIRHAADAARGLAAAAGAPGPVADVIGAVGGAAVQGLGDYLDARGGAAE